MSVNQLESAEQTALDAARAAHQSLTDQLRESAAAVQRAEGEVETVRSKIVTENAARAAEQIKRASALEASLIAGEPAPSSGDDDDLQLLPIDVDKALAGHPAVRALASIQNAHAQLALEHQRSDERLAQAVVMVLMRRASSLVGQAEAARARMDALRAKLHAFKAVHPQSLAHEAAAVQAILSDEGAYNPSELSHSMIQAINQESQRLREDVRTLIEGAPSSSATPKVA